MWCIDISSEPQILFMKINTEVQICFLQPSGHPHESTTAIWQQWVWSFIPHDVTIGMIGNKTKTASGPKWRISSFSCRRKFPKLQCNYYQNDKAGTTPQPTRALTNHNQISLVRVGHRELQHYCLLHVRSAENIFSLNHQQLQA